MHPSLNILRRAVIASIAAAVVCTGSLVSAAGNVEDIEVNRNCFVLYHNGTDTYIYGAGTFNYVNVYPGRATDTYVMKFSHHARDISLTVSRQKAKEVLDRYYACSGMELDKKVFP